MQKEKIRQIVEALPEEVEVDSLMEQLYLLEKIEVAERELANGEGVSDEEIAGRLAQWLK